MSPRIGKLRDGIAIVLCLAIGFLLARAADAAGLLAAPGLAASGFALAFLLLALYAAWRWHADRSASPHLAGTADRLRAALERARSAEERAESAHRRLVEAIEMIPEGFVLFDPEDRYLLWNSKFKELYAESADLIEVGRSFAEALRLSAARGQYVAAEGRVDEWVAERLSLHATKHGSHEQQLPDGRWLRIAERRLTDGSSIGIRIDITELKRREESIRLLFEDNPVPMYVFDRASLRFLEVNRAALQQYGYTREQFLAMTLTDIRPGAGRPRADYSPDQPETGFARLGRRRHRRADGSYIDVEILAHWLTFGGHFAGIIAAIDVTLQARAEAALRDSEVRLRQSEQHLAKAQRVAAIGSWEFDLERRRFRWSEELYRIHGLAPGGEPLDLAAVLAPVDAEHRHLIEAMLAEGERGGEIAGFDFRIVRPDGEQRILHCEGEVTREWSGAVSGLIGTAQDVTSTRRDEGLRRNLEHQLIHAQRMDALGTLAGGIAHDLNNALVPILAMSKQVRDRMPVGSRDHTSLDLVLTAVYRARDLVKQVLAFSRKEMVEKRPLRLDALVRETMAMLRASLPSSIVLAHDLAEVPPITGDAGQLHQVVVNLLTNAAYAIGGGQGRIEVRLGSGAGGREAVLAIRDTGCGMDEQTMSRIFDPFFTTKPVGEGTGLGLSVVHGIITSHGGRIEVTSRPGAGSEFVVSLPAAEESVAAD